MLDIVRVFFRQWLSSPNKNSMVSSSSARAASSRRKCIPASLPLNCGPPSSLAMSFYTSLWTHPHLRPYS
ncbi:hypothetical protein VTK73DRAFT_9243 [Phialemonium thermophilum]|uniref:Uncharacterized protein n=1 Tax=Phialemonium thermophilum TaxID=223376 RepID=A0ABR3XKR9_9PEZI